jgi:hypothetical protein
MLSNRFLTMPTPSINQIRRALQISEQIERLEAELASTLGNRAAETPSIPARAVSTGGRKRRRMSKAAREKIAAAQRARWARAKGKSSGGAVRSTKAKTKAKRTKGGITPEGRAKLAAMMKARWAARKRGAPAPNAKK